MLSLGLSLNCDAKVRLFFLTDKLFIDIFLQKTLCNCGKGYVIDYSSETNQLMHNVLHSNHIARSAGIKWWRLSCRIKCYGDMSESLPYFTEAVASPWSQCATKLYYSITGNSFVYAVLDRSHEIFLPRLRIVSTPSASFRASPGNLPYAIFQ